MFTRHNFRSHKHFHQSRTRLRWCHRGFVAIVLDSGLTTFRPHMPDWEKSSVSFPIIEL